ncbi:hypothetical protein SAMN05443637_107146 [Pseudonocardia thermophila]|jgi:hypothetical protein|uniref:Cupin domain-containing protein n=1 Tax=Pseudonocardia thermophila TaxID=1848 RepID=A0A1M6T490_PSETH|nr:hypothetical protein [Pseudonocardia thermophila]SHK51805.1 hypothetical protein SAMN05443637_107146 [Pseudonocardia thermophila]
MTSETTSATSAISTDPGDELIFANEYIRVWAMNLGPGESIFYHSHQYDHLILWPTPGRAASMEYDEDEEFGHIQNAEQGYAFFKTVGRKGGLKPHRLKNLEDHPVTHYIIELVKESATEEPGTPQSNGRGLSGRQHQIIDPNDHVPPKEERVTHAWS